MKVWDVFELPTLVSKECTSVYHMVPAQPISFVQWIAMVHGRTSQKYPDIKQYAQNMTWILQTD